MAFMQSWYVSHYLLPVKNKWLNLLLDLVKRAFEVQLHDDIKGHLNWISDVTTIMSA